MGRVAHNKLTFEQIKELYENENREILDIEVREVGKKKNKQTFIKYRCLIDEYVGWTSMSNLQQGKGCLKCGGKIKLTIEELKKLYENETREILDCEIREFGYKKVTYVKYKCLIDGYEDWVYLGNLKQGCGCPVCSGKKVHYVNNLSTIRPDLIKYFVNPEDANNYTVSSSKRVKLKCPECGMLHKKEISINHLSRSGFSCKYCSDGISIPEKFGICLLKQLNVDFETQKRFAWLNTKRYDFHFNDKILEIMGRQHYEECSLTKRTLKEEQENDLLKYNLAIKNGIKPENYIVIDCRYSTFEWLKENYMKSLNNHFDLSSVDWYKIWEDCQKSIAVKIWNAWNNRSENDTTSTIAKQLKLNRTLIRRYLKKGDKLGICNYNPMFELEKSINNNSIKTKERCSKVVYKYTKDFYFIKDYPSLSNAQSCIGVPISRALKDKTKSAGGFKWSYNPPINGMYPD